jgi:hypothetical protein
VLVVAVRVAQPIECSRCRPNYFASTPVQPGRDYMAQAGCDFARDKKCLVAGNPPTVGATQITHSQGGASQGSLSPARYTTVGLVGCTVDRRAYGVASVESFSSALPSQYQYFTQSGVMGGFEEADFCPVVSFYSNRICTDSQNNWSGGQPSNGYATIHSLLGNVFSPTSMCVAASAFIVSGYSPTSPVNAACVQVACTANNQVQLSVTKPSDPTQTISQTCTSLGAPVSFQGYSGTLTCPDPALVCGLSNAAPVAPAEPGYVGIAGSSFWVFWDQTASTPGVIQVARSLNDALVGALSGFPAASITIRLDAPTSDELQLAGVDGTVAGVPGQDLGFGSTGEATTWTVNWAAGTTGVRDVPIGYRPWPGVSEPAPRMFVVRVSTSTILSSRSTRAVLLLATNTQPAFTPTAGTVPGVSLAVVCVLLVVSLMLR